MDFRFWRKKKSEEQDTPSEKEVKVEYIKEIISLRNQLGEKEKELNEYATSKNCRYEFSRSFEIIEKYLTDSRYRPSVRLLESADIEYIENVLNKLRSVVNDIDEYVEKSKAKIDKDVERAEALKETTKEFLENPKMFFVSNEYFSEEEDYYFAYEFHINEVNGEQRVKALVTDNEAKHCWIAYIDINKQYIRPMTMEEFEKYFLPERIELQEFTKEEDIIEYDNYLRRLFNNQ
jgi:hypothetical protein